MYFSNPHERGYRLVQDVKDMHLEHVIYDRAELGPVLDADTIKEMASAFY